MMPPFGGFQGGQHDPAETLICTVRTWMDWIVALVYNYIKISQNIDVTVAFVFFFQGVIISFFCD